MTFVCLVQIIAGEKKLTVNMTNPQPQSSNTRKTSTTARRVVASEGGFQFEMKMAAVIGLRGLKQGHDFKLSSNDTDAGNFDDLVYTGGDHRYFLQLKHSDDRDITLKETEMTKLLGKFFKSYLKIKHDTQFQNISIDMTEFMIYTNRILDPEITWRTRKVEGSNIFFTTDNTAIFQFFPDEKTNQNLYTHLEESVQGSDIIVGSEDPGIKSLISEFLKKFLIVTGQKGHRKLDELIAAEICEQDIFKIDGTEYNSIFNHFKTRIDKWWGSIKREPMTPEMLKKWLQTAKTEYYNPAVNTLCDSCTKKLTGGGIKFSDSEISRLRDDLSDKRAVQVRSHALTLCSILLLNCLNKSKCIFVSFESLQSSKNMLLHAWLGGHWEWLIVYCDSTVQQSDISDTCLKIFEIIKTNHSTKRVIILTSNSVQQIKDFVPREHKFNFEHLSEQSQKIVLDKTIDFQGCEVTLRSVLQRHGNVQHVLGPELVTDLITEGTAVNIGGRLQQNADYYAPRFLERKIHLRLEVLQKPNIYREVLAVSGMTKDELFNIVPILVILENFSMGEQAQETEDEIIDGRFIVLPTEHTKTRFSELCQKYQKKTLHWLQYIPKDRKLLWKQSRGATENLLDYIDLERAHGDKMNIRDFMKSGSCEVQEKSIWDLSERTVLVVAEPGMGKSSTTTQVAWHTKLADSTSWVVRINWNDHTRELQEINEATFNFDSLVEFLCSAAFPKSKYTDTERILLKQALQNSGNVKVLMDGFDEISPIHAHKVTVLYSELKKTLVKRIWVTSRPVQKERLEKELSVTAFTLKKLPKESQKNMLCDIWKGKANREKLGEVAYDLLREVNESVYQRNLTGCPLNIIMIASALEGKLETSLNSEIINLTSNLNLIYLYDTFVERKLYNDAIEKKVADLTEFSIQDDQEMLSKIYLENLEKCSLLVTLPSGLNPLRAAEMQTTIRPFVERLQAAHDKIGIVMKVVDKRPHFVHPSLAEYFTARWFSKNIESNRNILEYILFDCSYGIVRNIFDRIMARGFPLHCAVLEEDKKNVRTLIGKGYNVNAVDKGGRTVMHIIATHHSKSWDVINHNCNYEVSLDSRDRVLQWTPLQYAIKSENWFIVERLLERNVDRSGLDMIRQRVHDADYINSIVRDSAEEKHVLLLEFLRTIGV